MWINFCVRGPMGVTGCKLHFPKWGVLTRCMLKDSNLYGAKACLLYRRTRARMVTKSKPEVSMVGHTVLKLSWVVTYRGDDL